jgi:VIT1/CCC1 family predicted Fe2+/Mn2+ transporter
MGASKYLAKKANEENHHAFKSSTYTTVAYIITVLLLILPYLLLKSYVYALIFTILVAVIVILVFNFYISVAKDLNFKIGFLEMAGISLGVAVLSFLIRVVVRTVFGIDV